MSISHLDIGAGERSSAPPVEFTVVRHGQTGENVRGILQGWLDTPLDERGVRQSRAVADRLRNDTFDRIVSSDLRRALESAAPLGEMLKLPVEGTPALREWHLGELEGRPVRELQREYPAIMGAFLRDPAEGDRGPGRRDPRGFLCADRGVSGCSGAGESGTPAAAGHPRRGSAGDLPARRGLRIARTANSSNRQRLHLPFRLPQRRMAADRLERPLAFERRRLPRKPDLLTQPATFSFPLPARRRRSCASGVRRRAVRAARGSRSSICRP